MSHPQAGVALASGGAFAATVYLLSVFGVTVPDPPPGVEAFLSALVVAIVFAIGRRGILGIARLILRGSGS